MHTKHASSTDRIRATHSAWTDRLIGRLERLPWPIWTTLGVLTGVGILVVHGFEWIFGSLPAGRFDVLRATFPMYPFGILALIAAQKRISKLALERFRPASGMDDEAYRAAADAFEHQPPRLTLVLTILFGLLGLYIELSKETTPVRLSEFPIALSFDLFGNFVGYMMAGPWLVAVVRLLDRVAQLHRNAPRVDLLNPEAVRAFSSATAFAGVSLIAIATLSLATDPATSGTTAGLALTILLGALALAAFVTPLWGMHRRLLAERARMLSDVGTRIQATLSRLYEHVDEDRTGVSELRDRMGALVSARDLIAHQSTWPWRPETLRWLISALVIPILLWGVTRLLESSLPS